MLGQEPFVLSSFIVTVALPQLSVAVNVTAFGTAAQETVTLAGAAAKVGTVMSCTVIVREAVVMLPQRSVAVQVRVIT